MIYYQTEGGPVISDKVSGGQRGTHSLDGLQRGVTYYISILALSQHLPSPLVGPVSVDTGRLFLATSIFYVFHSYTSLGENIIDTLGAHAQRGFCSCPVCVCVSRPRIRYSRNYKTK